MKLKNILRNVNYVNTDEFSDIDIEGIGYNSKEIKENYIFVAVRGFKVNGHKYIEKAIENGAKAIICDEDVKEKRKDIIYIKVENTRNILSKLGANYYDNPSTKINIIGITGTNGKTTTTYIIKSILNEIKNEVGIIGTIGNVIGEKTIETNTTTPESLDLQETIYNMEKKNVDTIAMEVSSHALDLYRADNIDFNVGLFTNLSIDHLDYHETIDKYLEAKTKLFEKTSGINIINEDDIYGKKIIEKIKNSNIPMMTYGLKEKGNRDITASNIEYLKEGTVFKVETLEGDFVVKLKTPGVFSVYNALASVSSVLALKRLKKIEISLEEIKRGLESLDNVKGRFELIPTNDKFSVIIDFAHTPDALENVLKSTKEFSKGRLVVVFGAGGDRDPSKRSIMGEVVGKYADMSIVTSDNPRTEDPKEIIKDVLVGTKKSKGNFIDITDREEAIEYAIENARKDDVIILAGKGHETYIDINNEKKYFDEREVVRKALDKRKR